MARAPWLRGRRPWLAGLAVVAAVAALVIAVQLPADISEARAMQGAVACETPDANSCMAATEGDLDGPYLTMRTGSDWYLWDDSGKHGPMSVSLVDGRRLSDSTRDVAGSLWKGALVEVELADGTLVKGENYGARLWVFHLLAALGLLSLAFGLAQASRLRSMATGLTGLFGCIIATMTIRVFGSVLVGLVVGAAVVAVTYLLVLRSRRRTVPAGTPVTP